MSKKPVIVYGASGYTGRLVCEYLRELGVPFIAAGRDAKRVQEVMDKVPGIETADYEVAEVEHSVEALTKLFKGAKVVCNMVGPFIKYGPETVEASFAAGCHYLDTTGEQDWLITLDADWSHPPEALPRLAASVSFHTQLWPRLLAAPPSSDVGQMLARREALRARLARENRGFYEKSFRLGESDLPTRLRIESEAFEAERALGRARIALAHHAPAVRKVAPAVALRMQMARRADMPGLHRLVRIRLRRQAQVLQRVLQRRAVLVVRLVADAELHLSIRSLHRHEEVAADAHADVVHAVQETREVGVQAGGQDLVDAAVLQVGQQAPCPAAGLGRLTVGQHGQVVHHLAQARVQ